MLGAFAKKSTAVKPDSAHVAHLYQAVTQLARAPVFYTRMNVPDTTDGRYDLLCLTLSLYLFRLQTDLPDTAQALFDLAFKDTERGLREVGVGDLSVSKHMKKMLQAFYGRASLYYDALAQNDVAALAAVLTRNLYNGTPNDQAIQMAEWVRIAWDFLQNITPQDLVDDPFQLAVLVPPDTTPAATEEAAA